MMKHLIAVGLSAGLSSAMAMTLTLATPAAAETVLERVERTGTFTVGTRTDAVPFAYINADGEWVGYSIDLLHLIHQRLEQELDRDITLDLQAVTVSDRIPRVEQGELDVVCGSTTYTSSRARRVDFSQGFFQTGTRFLIRADDDPGFGEIEVGIIPGTTNAALVEGYLRLARFVPVENRAQGLTALEEGRIDVFASDSVLLEGLRRSTNNPDAFRIIPPYPIQPEVYGCILPKENPEFLQLVNQTLIGFMQGVINHADPAATIFDRWFGENGVVPIDQTAQREFFQQTIEVYQETQK